MTPPEWLIKEILWSSCRGCRYIGIQDGMNDGERWVLFNPRSRETTLAVLLREFENRERAIELIHAKLATSISACSISD